MPIQVEGPDGQLLEFPDGTDRETMRAAMAKRYGGPTQPSAGALPAFLQAPEQPRPDFSNVTSGATTQPGSAAGGNAVTRALGNIGGRQVLQGAAGLYGALGGDALNHYVLDPLDKALFKPERKLSDLITGEQPRQRSVFGTGGRTYRDAASDLADELGMASPQNGSQRIASDVGEALTGTGLTLGVGAGVNALSRGAGSAAERLGGLLTAQPKLQAVSTATGAGASSASREGGGSQGQQLTAGLLAGLAPGVVSQTAGAATRGLLRGRDGGGVQRVIDDFAAVGAQPSAGQATGNRFLQGAENLLAGGPTSAGVMGRFAERQADDIGSGLQRQADNLSRNASAERAGRAIERGVEAFRTNRRAVQSNLYRAVDSMIPDQTPVGVQNTWQELVGLTTPTPGATATTGALVHPRIQQLRENLAQDVAANAGSLPYSALRAIRTQIGEQISDFSMTPDAPTRQLRQLYGALSRDMTVAAQGQGPQAAAAARRANDYTRELNNRLEEIQRVVDKNGGPERIFTAAMAGTKDGGTTLRKVMQSLPVEGQRSITAAVIKRMGMARPNAQDAVGDVFSADTFLTNWNNVSDEAKRAMFNRHGLGFSRDMDRIARVADTIKQSGKAFANPSGTANRAAAITYGGSLALSLLDPSLATTGSLVAAGASANASARLLTNPNFVRWLARTTEAPIGSVVAQANALREIGVREDDEEMTAFADRLAEESIKHKQTR